jgi:glycosyltransferase involved in cell wall biosynthesis
MKVSIIIPTLNEEKAIGKVLAEMPKDSIDEVIVVDSSSDATAKVAQGLGASIASEKRIGYGRALQTGLERARGDIVVYMDGDYTYDSKDIPLIVDPILSGKYDVAIGNRLNRRMHPEAMSFINRFGNLLISLAFSLLFMTKVYDTQSGMRAIRKGLLKNYVPKDLGMPYVTEQLIRLIKNGARVCNVPISYRVRIGSTKLCTWTDGLKVLNVMIRARLQR